MGAIEQEDWSKAAALVAAQGPVTRDLVEWHRLRASVGTLDEYLEFLGRRSDWPGLALMRKRGEQNIPKGASPDKVIAYFAAQKPRTGTGSLRLAAALKATHGAKEAEAEIIRGWQTLSLTKDEETAILARYGSVLADHHRARQDMLLWQDLATEAGRLNTLVGSGYRKLSEARIALIKGQKNGINALINAVPKSLSDDPGLAFARFEWRLRNKQYDGALALLQARSGSAKSLGKPAAWASRRRSMARDLMRQGKPKQAYALASKHFLEPGLSANDLEWLAGFIALSDLNDPALALKHFQRFRGAVETPISLGRAGYWEGRAHDALGDADAASLAYEFGAEYQTSFYGQLAAEKAGLPMDPGLTGGESYSDFTGSAHAKSSVFVAARLLQAAGEPLLFTRFVRQVAEGLSPVETGALAQFALDLGEPYAAIYLARGVAKTGRLLTRPYFPLTDIVSQKFRVPPELTLAIARRESEFFPASISPVGARGLMQLMPATAKEMAGRLNEPYSLDRLIDDPAYNARLGSAYLLELTQEFGPYYPFVAAGYNAGPSRPKRWVKQNGDPRRSVEAAVDWIEHIPFRETRNYVMRVMEALAVYRARLSGEVSELRLSKELVGR